MQPKVFECLKYELAHHVATLTLNRPARRNALNDRAYDEWRLLSQGCCGSSGTLCNCDRRRSRLLLRRRCAGAMVRSTPRPSGPGTIKRRQPPWRR